MLSLLFVYGTLKEGFPNAHINTGRRLPGEFKTAQRYPLLVVKLPNEDRAPWLMDQPGQGLQVLGQVFEVAPSAWPAMDQLEEVGLPTGYVRQEIVLAPAGAAGAPFSAFAYLKPAHHLPQALTQEGPFGAYTAELARGYCLAAR